MHACDADQFVSVSEIFNKYLGASKIPAKFRLIKFVIAVFFFVFRRHREKNSQCLYKLEIYNIA